LSDRNNAGRGRADHTRCTEDTPTNYHDCSSELFAKAST
jgi:hypothetical protein